MQVIAKFREGKVYTVTIEPEPDAAAAEPEPAEA
jgi:hypothetical protein